METAAFIPGVLPALRSSSTPVPLDRPALHRPAGRDRAAAPRQQGGPEHPFNLHGQFFSVVGSPEQGLHDTWLIPGLATVELDAYLDNPGRWMAHCHILEHAELGMMTEFVVGPSTTSGGHDH